MGSKQKRLRKARRTRRSIGTVFDMLRTHRVKIEDILETTPACLRNVTINDVLMHAPGMGRESVKKTLKAADVWPEDRMGDIPQGDRLRVIEKLPRRARQYEPTRSRTDPTGSEA